MIRSFTSRDVRTLLIGFVCVVSLLTYSRLMPWWVRTLGESRDAARETHSQLLSARALVRGRESTRDSLRLLSEQFLTGKSALLRSVTAAGAGVELAGLLSGFAAEAGVQLDIVQPLGDTLRVGPFVLVSVRTQLNGDVQGVMEMLGLIELESTLLAISSLTLTQSEPAAGDEKPEALRGEIIVRALFPQANPR